MNPGRPGRRVDEDDLLLSRGGQGFQRDQRSSLKWQIVVHQRANSRTVDDEYLKLSLPPHVAWLAQAVELQVQSRKRVQGQGAEQADPVHRAYDEPALGPPPPGYMAMQPA